MKGDDGISYWNASLAENRASPSMMILMESSEKFGGYQTVLCLLFRASHEWLLSGKPENIKMSALSCIQLEDFVFYSICFV